MTYPTSLFNIEQQCLWFLALVRDLLHLALFTSPNQCLSQSNLRVFSNFSNFSQHCQYCMQQIPLFILQDLLQDLGQNWIVPLAKSLSKCLHSKGIPTFYHLQRPHEFKAGSIRAAIVLQNANFTCGWMQLIFVHVWWPQTGWPQTGQQRPRCCLCRNIKSCPPRIGTVAACVLKIHRSQTLTVALKSSLIDLHIAHVSSWRPQISCSVSYFCCI